MHALQAMNACHRGALRQLTVHWALCQLLEMACARLVLRAAEATLQTPTATTAELVTSVQTHSPVKHRANQAHFKALLAPEQNVTLAPLETPVLALDKPPRPHARAAAMPPTQA